MICSSTALIICSDFLRQNFPLTYNHQISFPLFMSFSSCHYQIIGQMEFSRGILQKRVITKCGSELRISAVRLLSHNVLFGIGIFLTTQQTVYWERCSFCKGTHFRWNITRSHQGWYSATLALSIRKGRTEMREKAKGQERRSAFRRTSRKRYIVLCFCLVQLFSLVVAIKLWLRG